MPETPSTLPTESIPALYPASRFNHDFTPPSEEEERALIRRLRRGEMEADVERLRRFFFRQWAVVHELYLSPEADPEKLERWRSAPTHAPDWIKARDHDRAIRALLLWEAMRRP